MVAHQYVDGPGRLHRLRDGVGVPNVGAEYGDVDAGCEADGIAGLLEVGGSTSKDRDVGALRGSEAGEGEADAAGTPGDEDMAALDGNAHGAWAY